MSHERGRVAGTVVVGVGALVLFLTYLAVSGDPSITSQLSRIAFGGLGSLWLLAVGGATLIGTDLLDEWRKLDRIERAAHGDAVAGSNGAAPRLSFLPEALRVPAAVGTVVALVGLAIVLGAWMTAAGASNARAAFRALNVGVGGLVAAALGVAVGLFWMARLVRLRQSRVLAPWILADLQARLAARSSAARAAVGGVLVATANGNGNGNRSTAGRVTDPGQLVMVGAPLRRYHAPDCRVLTTGGPYKQVPLAKVPANTPACGLCLPEAIA